MNWGRRRRHVDLEEEDKRRWANLPTLESGLVNVVNMNRPTSLAMCITRPIFIRPGSMGQRLSLNLGFFVVTERNGIVSAAALCF